MKEENNANEIEKRQGVPLWAILAIIVLLLIGLSASKFDGALDSVSGEDIANVTLWSTSHKASTSADLKLSLNRAPDLSITIMQTGIINDENVFVETSSLQPSDLGAMRILVKNESSKVSEPWTLQISLPTKDGFVYNSEEFPPLERKQFKLYTISYDKITKIGQHELQVSLLTEDRKTANNLASALITIEN